MVRTYPRPNIDVTYTPAMDDYLKSFIQGISAPDKPLKELQDNMLDIFGPLCTAFEKLLSMESTIATNGAVQLDAASANPRPRGNMSTRGSGIRGQDQFRRFQNPQSFKAFQPY